MCTTIEPQAPRTQKGEKRNDEASEEYFFSYADSAEFASRQEPPEEVDKFKGIGTNEVPKEK